MLEKVAKIARVKGVDYDVGRRFDSRRHSDDEEAGSFASELRKVLNKKVEPKKTSEIPEAYKLDITSSGTHSLFYFGGLDLNSLLT